MLTAARASHCEAASSVCVCARASLSVCDTSLARRVLSVVFPFGSGQGDYALASKQETWRDQPQKQETEERDQTTVLAGLTMSEQALDPNGSIGDEM